MSLRAVVEPRLITTYPGFPVEFEVTVTNALHLVDAYSLRVLGVDPDWVSVDQARLQLFPGTVGVFQVRVDLPDDFPSGRRTLTVQVLSDLAPTKPTLLSVVLDIDTQTRVSMVVDPVMAVAGSKAQFAITVMNEGNSPSRVELACDDPESTSTATFDRPVLELGPGEQRSTTMRVKGKRPWFGQPTSRVLTLSLIGGSPGSERAVTMAHRPRISRIMVSFVGLLLAASVFGIVFSRNLTSVVESTTIDPKLLEQAFGSASPGAGVAPGQIRGSVIARSSSTGIAGATVEVFLADEPGLPIRSVATDEEGVFTVDNMGTGPFRLRAVAGGFDNRWLGDVSEFLNALPIPVEPGGTVEVPAIVLGGQPATLKGSVVGGTVAGARVEVIVPAAATGGVNDATLASLVIDDSGLFEFANIPAPGEYILRVRRIGSITTVIRLQLGAGETRQGVSVQLRTGDGEISGVVFDESGALGGAAVKVTSPDGEQGTLTLTTGAVGSFAIPGLLTPASYAVEVSADGYRTQSFTVSLVSGQQLRDLSVSLQPSTGSITGVLRSVTGARLGGVRVMLSDGATTWTTSTLTVDNPATEVDEIGTYELGRIPVPGVYTLTLGGGNFVGVVRNVVLTPFDRNEVADATLLPAVAVVSGTVRDAAGPAGGVSIVISDGINTRELRTATSCVDGTTTCVGTYRFEALPPGTYTITYRRVGSNPVSRQAVLTGGDSLVSDVTLAPQASIRVRLCSSGTTNATGGFTCSATALLVGYQARVWLETNFPGGSPLGSVLTGADGSAQFNNLDAPLRYVVDIAPAAGQAAVTSAVIALGASQALSIDILVPLETS
jgi:hypothetical protein